MTTSRPRDNRKHRFIRAVVIGCSAIGIAGIIGPTPASAQAVLVASPGDSPVDPGPLAKDLSAKFDRSHVNRALRMVADWQLKRLPEAPQTDWTFAALYIGLMSMPTDIAGSRYRAAVEENATKNQWMPGPRVTHADDQAIGQTYVELYMLHKQQYMLSPIRSRIDQAIGTPAADGRPVWWWADALFMAPPLLAELSRATDDSKYLDYMDKQWDITSNLLYDPSQHLFSRDSSYLQRHEANGQKLFWSRGNGWVMAGLARILQQLPHNSPHRLRYENQLREMAEAVAKVQGKDGLWRPGLLDANEYKLPEISGSAFITFSIAYGVKEGILDRNTYLPVLEHSWSGMLSHVYSDGRLGCIQPVGAAPGDYTQSASYVYGVGAFLLAGSEIDRLLRK